MVPEISVEALRDALTSTKPPRVLDVREEDELEISRLADIVHVPMNEVPDRLEGLDRDSDWVVMCRSGKRSAAVTQYLLANGFRSVRNVEGGMNAWAERVDPSLTVY